MSSIVEILIAAKALIDTPEKWTKGVLARRSPTSPFSCAARDPEATCWCAQGALVRVTQPFSSKLIQAESLLEKAMGTDVPVFNDGHHTTHADVMDAFDRAIELAKEAK